LHVHSSEPFFLTHFFFCVYVFFYYFYAYMLNNFLLLVAKGRALCKSIYHKFHTHAGTHRHPQKRRRTPMAPNELQAHIYTHTHTHKNGGEQIVRSSQGSEFGVWNSNSAKLGFITFSAFVVVAPKVSLRRTAGFEYWECNKISLPNTDTRTGTTHGRVHSHMHKTRAAFLRFSFLFRSVRFRFTIALRLVAACSLFADWNPPL